MCTSLHQSKEPVYKLSPFLPLMDAKKDDIMESITKIKECYDDSMYKGLQVVAFGGFMEPI